ncbi:MAG: MBL fold metallo-hydrolase [Candidatus Doudnabacteria bacterium]
MHVEILGSGGSFTIPRPGCRCRVCVEAKRKGLPYSRTGPSLFVHGPNILIDTPEEIKDQLNRSSVNKISACAYSHWHGDHVMGRRVWWSMNYDFGRTNPRHRSTDILIPQQVAADFRTHLGSWQHLSMLEEQGMVRLIVLADGESIIRNGTAMTPFRLAENFVYGLTFQNRRKKLVVIPDDMFSWQPTEATLNADLAILPMGIATINPLTGKRQISKNHPVLVDEATLEQTIEVAHKLEAKKVVLTHIEEHDHLSYADLKKAARKLRRTGMDIEFAYDTMVIEI